MPYSIRLHCFPKDDRVFLHRAADVLGSLKRDGRSDGELAEEFGAAMRIDFPDCQVRSKEPLAMLWPEGSVWYVYRDGRALSGKGPTPEETAAGPGQDIAEIQREP
jgi:hypothetical protein